MSELEHDLRETLKRREAPEGFAERVLARAQEIAPRSPRRALRAPWRRWAAVAAVLAVLIGGGVYREHRRQLEEEKAKQQLLFALRLTGSKLHSVQQRLSRLEQRKIELVLE